MALSPMMEKYLETKKEYPDCILFYRLGDFYEMFFEDAELVSRELGLTLTGKDCGLESRAPMCGVPYHAVDAYLDKLVLNGHKVAIAEQMEDPRFAKGLVKREVTRVVTPGTVMGGTALDETKNRYIMGIVYERGLFGYAFADISTGEFCLSEAQTLAALQDEILRFAPAEIVCNEALKISGLDFSALTKRIPVTVSVLDGWRFREEQASKTLKAHFGVASLESLGITSYPVGTVAAGALLSYLLDTQKQELSYITHLKVFSSSGFMQLDAATRRNLELLETLREKQKRGSLLWVLDKTRTAMGARTLRRYIEQPLIVKKEIQARLDAVETLKDDPVTREELREYLNPIYDLERLIGRISYRTANPRDLIAFRNSLEMLPHIRQLLLESRAQLLRELAGQIDPLEDLFALIRDAIEEDPPVGLYEGGIIRDGYHEDVDRYRKAKTDGKGWIAEIEAEERERTGIRNLKIRFNKVFGYYLEVTNSFKDLVPEDYIRKQTLTGAERYITPRLKELEDMILGAEDKLYALENQLFCTVRDTVSGEVERIQRSAAAVASLDALASLAKVASDCRYVRPAINEKGRIRIRNGRHPVIERMIQAEQFVPNDTFLDQDENRIAIITGPNMAGKSTYMRQTALIALMAQMGSFVPAEEADICISDRIFTRVGASDDLASGQSTFMVEMTEVANILRNATRKSLIILDEIGRGTSTFDGMSIAWAVVEYIANPKLIGAKTLFATHYHELTELEGAIPGVQNYCISVREQGDSIVFLRKIVKGGADRSYGIQVARLAGVPNPVLVRAGELVEELVNTDIAARAREIASYAGAGMTAQKKRIRKPDDVDLNQLSLFDTVREDDVLKEIEELDLTSMTPLDTMNVLFRIQSRLKNRIKPE
ncbi:MAG: DNA mismatch repair protein MutS [Lachnospiraceae bacterium]|nr:DNA mismatch repair protein MutS [Lachnospiraceae bacterium]